MTDSYSALIENHPEHSDLINKAVAIGMDLAFMPVTKHDVLTTLDAFKPDADTINVMNSMSDVEFARRCNDADLDALYECLWSDLSDRHNDLVNDVSSEIARQIIEDYNIS